MQPDVARETFLAQLRQSVEQNTFVKLTLGNPAEKNSDCHNLFVRPVTLKAGPHLCLVWRHATKDITKNYPPAEALAQIAGLIGTSFMDAHLFTQGHSHELRCVQGRRDRLIVRPPEQTAPVSAGGHDRAKTHLIAPSSPWLRALDLTNEQGQPKAEMSAKYRQIQKYAELLRHLLAEANLWPVDQAVPPTLRVVDMGCGKGYLTFTVAALLGNASTVAGIELRPELAAKSNETAKAHGFSGLHFAAGTILDAPLEAPDLVIALHACDTATDDALARGIAAEAKLLVVAPCCQKELRPQLNAPEVLIDALRHGIFQERQAEFLTDALRAELLEWAGYRTKVFEFISTEHTAKNLMIAAIKSHPAGDPARAERIRALARFYGIRHQQLAKHLGFDLAGS
ncbi:MAG: SAM-dependent methyltransferase [Opitutaceae bacterium]|jgi:SAM-dependent methyltransferase